MVETKVYESFEECESAVRPFLQRATANPFLQWDWLQECWRMSGASRRGQLMLIAVSRGGELVSLAPLVLAKSHLGVRRAEFVGEFWSDRNGFAGETSPEVLEAVTGAVRRLAPRAFFRFTDLVDAEPLHAVVKDADCFAETRFVHLYPYPYMELAFHGQAKVSKSHKKFLQRVRSLRERVSALGELSSTVLDFDRQRSFARTLLPHLLALHHLRHQGTMNTWCRPHGVQFLRELMENAETTQMLAFISSIDGIPVGFDMGFREGDTFSLYLTAFHPAFHQFGLGHVTRLLAFQNCAEIGINLYDFSKGANQAKRLWMTGQHAEDQFFCALHGSPLARLAMRAEWLASRAKVRLRDQGVNRRVRCFLGRFIEPFTDQSDLHLAGVPIPRESAGEARPIRLRDVIDLPVPALASVAEFVFSHGRGSDIMCRRLPGSVQLTAGKDELIVPVRDGAKKAAVVEEAAFGARGMARS